VPADAAKPERLQTRNLPHHYEKIFERDLLRVHNARTPLEALVYPPQPEEESEAPGEESQQSADETNSALANQT
jgi:hypothetical protein